VDLAVVDEAQRTSGSMDKAWAEIHDQAVTPGAARVEFDGTSRICEER
jgi:hypothetical protein